MTKWLISVFLTPGIQKHVPKSVNSLRWVHISPAALTHMGWPSAGERLAWLQLVLPSPQQQSSAPPPERPGKSSTPGYSTRTNWTTMGSMEGRCVCALRLLPKDSVYLRVRQHVHLHTPLRLCPGTSKGWRDFRCPERNKERQIGFPHLTHEENVQERQTLQFRAGHWLTLHGQSNKWQCTVWHD